MYALALENGKIWTGDGFATSLLIRGNRIQSIDGATQGALSIDLGGKLVLPGFIDNHVHFVAGGLQAMAVSLREATSLEEFAGLLAERSLAVASGEWITGGGWDEQRWTRATLPDRHSIDRVTLGRPAFVTRMDMHMGLANSEALRRSGITKESADPPGGSIVRDETGEPTGILKDAAMKLVDAVIPPASIDQRIAAIRAGLREAARFGVTSFCDMGMSDEAFDDLRAYQRLDRIGELTARARMYLPIGSYRRLQDAGIERHFGSERLRIAGLKGFADGSLGSSTAAFHNPYEGEAGNRGLFMAAMEDGSMARWIEDADEHELQIAIHAIGDRANDEVLRLFEARPRHQERRFRIEHAQHLDPQIIRRFAAAGVIASMQPAHAADDGRWAESRIGATRTAMAYPFRSLLDAGASVTFGSDWPVASLDPIRGIVAAVTRQTIDGKNAAGWIPEQKVNVEEALRCYTAANAWATFSEKEVGAIAPGMLADLAVLSGDLFSVAPEEIERVTVEMTIFDGRVVYES